MSAIVTTALSSVDGAAGVLRYRGVSVDEFSDYGHAVGVVVDGVSVDRSAALVAKDVPAVTGAENAGRDPDVYASLRAAIAGVEVGGDVVEFAGACGRAVGRLRGRFVDRGTYAGRILRGIVDGDVDDDDIADFDACFVVHLDHALNPGTLAVRIAASTGAPLSSSLIAGLCALEGPLHGGASSDVGAVLEQLTADQATSWWAAQKAQKKKVPGFGHPIYKTHDPRSAILRKLCERAAVRQQNRRFFDAAVALDDAVRASSGGKLFPNVDFYAAALYATLGVPRAFHTACFFAARVVGWAAHAVEQQQRGKIISPESDYDGPAPRSLASLRS